MGEVSEYLTLLGQASRLSGCAPVGALAARLHAPLCRSHPDPRHHSAPHTHTYTHTHVCSGGLGREWLQVLLGVTGAAGGLGCLVVVLALGRHRHVRSVQE